MDLLKPNRNFLLQKWQKILNETRHIRTWTSDSELAWLAEYAQGRTAILEIGSYVGRSAKVMLMANPSLRIYSLDTWDDVGTHQAYQHNLGPEIAAGRVNWWQTPSHDGLKRLYGAAKFFDGAFIDGGHLEADVRGDIEGLKPLMRAQSLICGHDYRNDPRDGVDAAVNALLPQRINVIDSIWIAQL